MKKCFKCGIEKELTEFYKHPAMADGTVNKCKECNKKDVRDNRSDKLEYYQDFDRNRFNANERSTKQGKVRSIKFQDDLEYREERLQWQRDFRKRDPNRYGARGAISNALRDGKIKRPDCCEHCGDSEKKIQGHHWSYLPEHWLDVIWLCTSCHGKEHKRLNELGRDPDKQIKGETNDHTE